MDIALPSTSDSVIYLFTTQARAVAKNDSHPQDDNRLSFSDMCQLDCEVVRVSYLTGVNNQACPFVCDGIPSNILAAVVRRIV
jgi:hypothetical protein